MLNKKKKFFKNKIESVEKAIWDIEFKIAKSRQVREGVRQDRDRSIEAIAKIEAAIKGTEDKDIKKKLEEELAAITSNKSRYESQMQMIDDEINGGKPSEVNPSGAGLIETIAGYNELRLMIQDYITKL